MILNICLILLIIIVAYLIGSLNASIIISKFLFKKDVRKFYSKNAGATNIKRMFGFKWGLIVFFLDAFKPALAMFFAFIISLIFKHQKINFYIYVFFVSLGHTFPIFFKFRGGKNVSCVIGTSFIFNIFYFLILALIFWTIYFWKHYISLASIMAMLVLGIVCWIPFISNISNYSFDNHLYQSNYFLYFNLLHNFSNKDFFDYLLWINITLDLCIILSISLHYANIKRLFSHKEKKFFLCYNKNKK